MLSVGICLFMHPVVFGYFFLNNGLHTLVLRVPSDFILIQIDCTYQIKFHHYSHSIAYSMILTLNIRHQNISNFSQPINFFVPAFP